MSAVLYQDQKFSKPYQTICATELAWSPVNAFVVGNVKAAGVIMVSPLPMKK